MYHRSRAALDEEDFFAMLLHEIDATLAEMDETTPE